MSRTTQRQVLKRYPLLVAHMICESLGYFCVLGAANALAAYIDGETCACEWYSHMAMCRGKGMFDREALLEIGKQVVERAFLNRHRHKGYMADFQRAIAQVKAELEREGCTSHMLAAWF
jgi:hypothetical protein